MSDDDDDEDDLAMEELQNMSDDQIEATFSRMMKEYSDNLDAMTSKQRYEFYRRRRLDLCLRQRKLIKDHRFDFFIAHLKETQRRLLEARIEYRTGKQIGHS